MGDSEPGIAALGDRVHRYALEIALGHQLVEIIGITVEIAMKLADSLAHDSQILLQGGFARLLHATEIARGDDGQ